MNHDWQVRPLAVVVEAITRAGRGERDGGLVVVAINGHGSSGKTSLSRRLVGALPDAGVLHTDDLAWWQGVFGWGSLLLTDVLPVVRSGAALAYRPPQWVARGREGSIELPSGLSYLLVEGVGASMPALRHIYDLMVWVETDEPTRAERDARRLAAGEMTPSGYQRWMGEENAYVVAEQPWLDADLVINGGDSVDHDRATEVVLSGRTLPGGDPVRRRLS